MTASFALAIPQGKKAPKIVTHQASGTIKAIDINSMVLAHKVGGKEQDTAFILTAETKREGVLKAGVKATVHYRIEGGKNIATAVLGPKK